jgi:hypothetical protein
MPALTFRLGAGQDGSFAAMNEVDQAAASRADGWTVGKIAPGLTSDFDVAVKQLAATFTSNTTFPKPSASLLTGAAANAFKSQYRYLGSFAAANWALTIAVRATVGSAQTGRVRARVFASVNADGSSSRDLNGAVLPTGATTAALTSSADGTSLITWTAPAITLSSEYLFIAIAWDIVVASGSNNGDALLRTGQSAGGTRIVTSNFTGSVITGQPIVSVV